MGAEARFLGDFTAAVEEHRRAIEPAVFELYGEKFTTATALAGLPYMEFAHAATSGLDSSEARGQAAMLDFIKGCLNDEDWPRFRDLVVRERVSGDGLFALASSLVEVFSGGPTSSPSDSEDGQSTTTPESKDDSPSPPAGLRPVSSAV